jgi:hypothetical protein
MRLKDALKEQLFGVFVCMPLVVVGCLVVWICFMAIGAAFFYVAKGVGLAMNIMGA